jgi:arabinogalactan oligomer/maltooligosaccharide transport system permease protein
MSQDKRHQQVLALNEDASEEEIQDYRNKKRRIALRKTRDVTGKVFHNLFLAILAFFWIIPIIWLVLSSLDSGKGLTYSSFFPSQYTFSHYIDLLSKPNSVMNFPKWFVNTLWVSALTCVISTLFVLGVSFALSRMRFKGRKALMNVSMILGLFPGFLSMIAVYFILQALGISGSLFGLALVYSASSGLGYLIAKGFFDTIPKDIDEAAKIDGASEAQIFFKITIPLSKPIIVYTILTSFMGPWVDFVFAQVILGSTSADNWTVAIGLYHTLDKSLLSSYFTEFCAGAVVVSIPLSILFLFTQKYYVAGVTGGAVKG